MNRSRLREGGRKEGREEEEGKKKKKIMLKNGRSVYMQAVLSLFDC